MNNEKEFEDHGADVAQHLLRHELGVPVGRDRSVAASSATGTGARSPYTVAEEEDRTVRAPAASAASATAAVPPTFTS